MKILICEHDEVLLHIMEFTIARGLDAKVDKALDGKQAIRLLQKSNYDLVLIEISIPHYSGIDIIKFIRENQKLDTPIIVISNDTKESTMIQVKRLGIREYVFKPFYPLELLKSISKYL